MLGRNEGSASKACEEESGEEREAKESTVMQVAFHIPGPLREFTSRHNNVHIDVPDGATVLDALHALFSVYPGLRDRVVTEAGEVRRHVNIFVANENVRFMNGLATALPPEAEVSIVPAISGG